MRNRAVSFFVWNWVNPLWGLGLQRWALSVSDVLVSSKALTRCLDLYFTRGEVTPANILDALGRNLDAKVRPDASMDEKDEKVRPNLSMDEMDASGVQFSPCTP